MKKICKILSISLCLAMLLSVNAFAAAPDEIAYGNEWPETTTETTAITETTTTTVTTTTVTRDEPGIPFQEPDPTTPVTTTDDDPALPTPVLEIEPDRPVGIPPRRISSWLSEQIMLETDYCEVYGTKDVTVVHLRLSDATKIVFVADQLCPMGYTDDGGFYASGIGIPCGINQQLYRYLDTVSGAAAMYDFGGAKTLMAKYSPEELAAIYDEVREAALPYHGELIEWLDSFSVTIRVPNYGTLWNGIIVPQSNPVEETAPAVTAIP